MNSSTMEKVKSKLMKCYKYRDLETAIYLSMYISQYEEEYALLNGILLYENREYYRSLISLKNDQGTTATYYRALCYKSTKKYSEASKELVAILENKTRPESTNDGFIKQFLINSLDSEFFESLLGSIMILKGKCKTGVEKYRNVMFKNPLLLPCLGLFDENVKIEPANQLESDPIMDLFQDLFKCSIEIDNKDSIDSENCISDSMSDFIRKFPFSNQYFKKIPGIGSYFLSKIASSYCRQTNSQLGLQMFDLLREKDPGFDREMDIYSIALWVGKEINLLGLLAKDLIVQSPESHITWSVIGNYYSLCGMQKESTTCLMKSLNIKESPTAYSLLGFEFNIRNQYLDAQNYFKSSLCMLENNDRAYFGLGIAYGETSRKQAAEAYFKKALSINPRNENMKAFLVRFYVKNDENEKAINKIREFLGLESENIEEIVFEIKEKAGKYTEIEELIICEFIEILLRMKNKAFAEELLQGIQIRTSTYYMKKNMIENDV